MLVYFSLFDDKSNFEYYKFIHNSTNLLLSTFKQVGLAFCTLYTFTYRTTWCIFPFTLIAMCWCKLLAQCRCGKCGILCCARDKKNPTGSTPGKNADTMPLTVRYETSDSRTINSVQERSDNKKGSPGGIGISIPICDTTFLFPLIF